MPRPAERSRDVDAGVATRCIEELARSHRARVGVWFGSAAGECLLARAADEVQLAASTIKLPVLIALHIAARAGVLGLGDQILVDPVFRSPATGELFEVTQDYDNDPDVWSRVGQRVDLGWLGERAIVRSSNLATNLLAQRLGLDAVNRVLEASASSGCSMRKLIQDHGAEERGLSNSATAEGMAAVLVGLAQHRLLGAADSVAVEDILTRCEADDAIPAGLPAGLRVAHKTGSIDGVQHDVALLRPTDEPPLVLAIMTTGDFDEPAGAGLVAQIASACWQVRFASAAPPRRGRPTIRT